MGIGYQQTLNLSTPFSGKGIKKLKNKQDRPISQPQFFTHTVRAHDFSYTKHLCQRSCHHEDDSQVGL